MAALANPIRNRYRPQDYAGAQEQPAPYSGDAYSIFGDEGPIVNTMGEQADIPGGDMPPLPPPQGVAPLQGYRAPSGAISGTNDPTKMIQESRGYASGAGNAIDQATVDAQKRYGDLEEQYRQKADEAYGQLQQQPGYTPDEASQINRDYGQYRTSGDALQERSLTDYERAGIQGDPRSAMAYRNPNMLSSMTDDIVGWENKANTEYGEGLRGAVNQDDLRQSQGYQAAAKGATDTEESALNAAVDRSKLGLDPEFQGRQLTDEDVQAMKTAAGRRVGNQYRAAQDDLERRAAAQGNTSPVAIAAARARLERQAAADSGNAEAEADINARQAQFGRAEDIENMRGSREQDISNRQMSAAQTVGAQRAQQAQEAENMRLGAEQFRTGVNVDVANKAGQANIEQMQRAGQQKMDTALHNEQTGIEGERYGEQQASDRSLALAQNRQAAQKDIQDTAYTQGMQTGQATAQGAQTVGDAARAGQQEYRNYQTGQQQAAQQGGTEARSQQIQGYGVQSGALNTAAGQKANYDIGEKGTPGAGERIGMGIVNALFEEGGVVTKPTVGVVGENGPEMVVPATQQPYPPKRGGFKTGFKSMMQNTPVGQVYGAMTKKPAVVTHPTVMMLGDQQPEAVVPLNRNPRNRVPPAAQMIARYRGIGG